MARGNIKDYKDRMTAPVGAVQINPKTRKPITKKAAAATKKRGK